MVKNIIFDLGGVLLDISMERTMKAFASLGFNIQELIAKEKAEGNESMTTMCEGVSAAGFIDAYSRGMMTTDECFNTILSFCHPGTTIEQVESAWNSCLFTIPQHKMDMIRKLHKDHNIYMLSNTNDAHWQYILKNSFPDAINPHTDFDKIFLSQEMRMAKPNKEIFLQVLKKIGAKAEDCLFIDDATINTEAASALGFKTYTASVSQLNPDGTFTKPDEEWCDVILGMI